MARAIHWRIPFVSLDNTPYQVNIYEEGYQGSVVILKGGAQPFVTEELDDPDAFLPIRTSSGYISVICESASLVNDILPVNVHDRYVELVDVTPNANKVAWNGYVMPEEYSGDWNVTPFELSLPVASPIGASLALDYTAFERVVTIGDVLRKILKDIVEWQPTYIMSGKFPAQTASMMTAMFSDTALMNESEGSDMPAYGNGHTISMGDERTTIENVLEAFCRLYGYVLHESPDALWFCSSDMSTDYYRTEINYDTLQSYSANESVVSVTDADLPSVCSASNTRTLLPGKSAVRVFCEAEEVKKIFDLDISKLTPNHFCSNWTTVNNRSDGYQMYPRDNTLGMQCFQYDVSDDSHAYTNMSMFEANEIADDCALFGANFISYARWKTPNYIFQDEYDKYSDGLLLCLYPQRSVQPKLLARLTSSRPYSALNFVENGIRFNAKCQGGKAWNDMDFKWKYNSGLVFVLRWGEYTFIADTPMTGSQAARGIWGNDPEHEQFPVMMSTYDKNEAEGYSTLFKVNPSMFDYQDFFGQITDVRKPSSILLAGNNISDVNGYIRLEVYGEYASDIVYVFLKELSIEHIPFSMESLEDSTDHYLSDFRRRLSNSKNEEYEYEQKLNNLMVRYSPSGVLPPTLEQGSSADYYEQTILDRLASWYDRTIEQITVTVQNENISPGQRIVRGNGKYIVVSKAHNWRDGMVTLTMQKLYEQAQA